MSTASPITLQQSLPPTETGIMPSSLPLSLQSPQISLQPMAMSPQSPTSPLPTGASSVHNGEMQSFEGYVARRSAVLKRWKDRKPVTVINGMFAA